MERGDGKGISRIDLAYAPSFDCDCEIGPPTKDKFPETARKQRVSERDLQKRSQTS